MKEIGIANTKSIDFRRQIVEVIRREKDPNKRTLNEIARVLLASRGKNPENFSEKSRMLGSLSYHMKKLIDKGRVEKAESRNANIYTAVKSGDKNVSRADNKHTYPEQGEADDFSGDK